MAEGHGDGVGGVVGLGQGIQVQEPAGHVLDLVLGGVAVANHRLLDLHRLVGIHRQPRLTDGQQNDSTALGHTDARGHVLPEEQFFNRHRLRPGDFQQLPHILIDHFQPCGKIRPRRGGDDPAAQQPVLAPVRFDEAEARQAVARVNAQYPHQPHPRNARRYS